MPPKLWEGVFPLDQIVDVGVSLGQNLKVISHEIVFEVYVNMLQTHRQTDGRLTEAYPR